MPMSPTGSTLEIRSIKVCVVYDERSGHIHHQHHVLTLVGGYEPGDEDIARDAMAVLRQEADVNTAALRVLHVPPDALEHGQRYRVDPAKRALVREGAY